MVFDSSFNPKCVGGGNPMSLQSLLISIRNSLQSALDEEDQIPLEYAWFSYRNSIQHALEKEAQIPLQS
jgi:hypothetical protein